MLLEKIIKDKVLICIISQDDVTVTPDAMADFRGVAQDLNHEVIFFSSPKDRHLLKQPIKAVDSKFKNIDAHFIFEELGYGELQKLAFQYSIKHKFDIVVILHQRGDISQELLKNLISPLAPNGGQAVLGSRFRRGEGQLARGLPTYKKWGSKAVTFLQNKLLGSNFSDFHSRYRSFRVETLNSIPFQFNSEGYEFDSEIMIQLWANRCDIVEIPIPASYGKNIRREKTLAYVWKALKVTFCYRLHQMSLFYHRKFDIERGFAKYKLKKGFPSSHEFAMQSVNSGSRVLDVGCGNSLVAGELKKKGCYVEAIDYEEPQGKQVVDRFTKMNINDSDAEISVSEFDNILLLDILEHVEEPEKFTLKLRKNAAGKTPKVIISVPNIAFFVTRVQLLLGNFNYGIRGTLDLGHRRLFTFKSIRQLFQQAGYRILTVKGVPAPFPMAIGDNWLSRWLLIINQLLIKLFPRLFAYQIFLIASPLPTLDDHLNKNSV
jgi:2-polyprenyl-3-methyl-5-hydroxy-6-metoxy-1,4-benzoquinol methylase